MGRPSTFHTRLFKRWLHIPAINLSFISDSQQHLWCNEKKNRKIIIYYLSRKMHSLLTLSINGKAILTFRMTIWENFFCYLILLCSNRMLRLSSIKCFTIYFIQIKNYSKSVSEQMMFVPFVRLNQKVYTISFTNVLTQGDFATILSLIGAVYQIKRFVFHCGMLYFVSYLSNALQPNY